MTERVSVSSAGVQANGGSNDPDLSGNGRYVTFNSNSGNLVTGDTNGGYDIFVHDRRTGVTERVSVSSDGAQAISRPDAPDVDSHDPGISANGRYVTFNSYAGNLVAGDTNGTSDIFVHDRQTGVTERVSVSSAGNQSNHYSHEPSISADGRFVVFYSHASNLVAGDTNDEADIFVHDRQTGVTERVSVSSAGVQSNDRSRNVDISADGRHVIFMSLASNLVAGDTNGADDIFVHDRQTGLTERVSVDSAGGESNGSAYNTGISVDGRFITFDSIASNLVPADTNGAYDIFVHDRQTGVTERVSASSTGNQSNHDSADPSISADGRIVTFISLADNLVRGDTNGDRDVFVHDRQTGVTRRVSVDSAGTESNGHSEFSEISASAGYVSFKSAADNLVPGDTNNLGDIFVTADLRFTEGDDTVSLLDMSAYGIIIGETVDALAGDDTVTGGPGDDVIVGGAGNDTINGAAGSDGAGYETSDAAVSIDLMAGTASDGHATGDMLISIENLYGSRFNDRLFGDDGANTLAGNTGRDVLDGRAGADSLDGGANGDWVYYSTSPAGVTVDLATNTHTGGYAQGDDLQNIEYILGSTFDDTLTGGSGNDWFIGNVGRDVLVGSPGNDVMHGGAGGDWLYYSASPTGVTVDLATGLGSGGHAEGDTLVLIENVLGSSFADTLSGTDRPEFLFGNTGQDTIAGRGGADFLLGGELADRLDGGPGDDILIGDFKGFVSLHTGISDDVFVFQTGSDRDTIRDFQNGLDVVDLDGSYTAAERDAAIASATQVGTSVQIDFGGEDTVTLEDFTLALLDAGDFVL